jgi:hypothetical protein
MECERGGRAAGTARRGTHATGSGGSAVFWCSKTAPRPRRPAPGTLRPREHDVNDEGVSRLDAGPGTHDVEGPLLARGAGLPILFLF